MGQALNRPSPPPVRRASTPPVEEAQANGLMLYTRTDPGSAQVASVLIHRGSLPGSPCKQRPAAPLRARV